MFNFVSLSQAFQFQSTQTTSPKLPLPLARGLEPLEQNALDPENDPREVFQLPQPKREELSPTHLSQLLHSGLCFGPLGSVTSGRKSTHSSFIPIPQQAFLHLNSKCKGPVGARSCRELGVACEELGMGRGGRQQRTPKHSSPRR